MASLKLNPSENFGEEDHRAVEQYRFGVFEETTFRRMLVLLTFPPYKPDRGVRTFNATRFAKLDLGEPSYANQISAPAPHQKKRVLESDKPGHGARRDLGSRRATSARSFLTRLIPTLTKPARSLHKGLDATDQTAPRPVVCA